MRTLQVSALTLMLVGSLATGCRFAPAQATLPSSNANVAVDVLFTIDNCTMYRFTDGNVHYFARCEPRTAAPPSAMTINEVSCGKHCRRDEEIDTLTTAR